VRASGEVVFLRTSNLKEMSGLLCGGLLFSMLFTDFSDVFVFSVCVCMPLRRLLMLKKRGTFVRIT
jgi:hypothetical protein